MVKKFVLRTKLNEIKPYLDDQEIIVILGPRRTGKTTLLFQIKDFLVADKKTPENDIYFFNLDLIDDLMAVKDQPSFIKYIKSRIKNRRIYFFIDEIQRLENPGLFFKGIYDISLPVKFILTGSSSLEIKSKIQEALTGRKRIFYLLPFSFEEFLLGRDARLLEIKNKNDVSEIDKKSIRNFLNEFMVWGGYPEVCLEVNIEKKLKALEEIFNSYIEKDIVNFLKIEDKISFARLNRILAAQVGNLVNINELSSTLGIKNETAKKYLEALEATFVIKLLPPFFKNTRKEITKMPKVYFIDNGLRNFTLRRFDDFEKREDKGELLENYIFSFLLKELRVSDKLYFWRTKDKAEVDFIVERDTLLPIESKALSLHKPIFPRALLGFSKNYDVTAAIVVNLELESEAQKGSLKIYYQAPENLKILRKAL